MRSPGGDKRAAKQRLATLRPVRYATNDVPAFDRAYYAAFHYARALLVLLGFEPKTHWSGPEKGVVALLSQHYERTGRLNAEALSRAVSCWVEKRRDSVWRVSTRSR
jgi:uncharacterized protein (UPF0332 family)